METLHRSRLPCGVDSHACCGDYRDLVGRLGRDRDALLKAAQDAYDFMRSKPAPLESEVLDALESAITQAEQE